MDEQNVIGEVFDSILKDVKSSMKNNKHSNPVDLEVSFQGLEVSKRKRLFVPKKSQRKEISIRLATRISPEATS